MKSTLANAILAMGICFSPLSLNAEGEPKAASATASAVSPEHRELVEKLFEISDTAEQYNSALVHGFDAAMQAQAEQMPAETKAKMAKGIQKVKDLMLAEMGWAKIKDEIIGVYADTFTMDDLKGIIKILDNAEAREFFKKMGKLQAKMATFAQSKTQELTPKIMPIMLDAMGDGDAGGEP